MVSHELLADIFHYLLNAAFKFRLVGYSLFIISITCSYVVSERNSQQQTHPYFRLKTTDLISTTGVLSTTSRDFTLILQGGSTAMMRVLWRPIGLGLCGERVANTPCIGFSLFPLGWTFNIERSARCIQVKTTISSPASNPSKASAY